MKDNFDKLEEELSKICCSRDDCKGCRFAKASNCAIVFGYEQGLKDGLELLKSAQISTVSINGEYFITVDSIRTRMGQIMQKLGIVEGK